MESSLEQEPVGLATSGLSAPLRGRAMDLLPVGVIITDTDGAAVYANQVWTDLTGQDPAWRGYGWLQVIDVERRDHEQAAVLEHVRKGTAYEADWPVVAPGGQARVLHITAVPGTDDGAVIGMVVSASDVTAERDQAAWLIDKVTHDWLTGLYNRPQFLQFLSHALDRVRRQPRHPAAVFFIDVDNLKAANDTYGHDAGDRLLRAVAARVTAAVRPADLVARYGGDEFAVLCEDLPNVAEATAIAARIRASARRASDGAPPCELTVGFTVIDVTATDPASVVELADRAMYRQRQHPSYGGSDRALHSVPAPDEAGDGRRRPFSRSGDPAPADAADTAEVLATAAHALRAPLTTIVGYASLLRAHRERMTADEVDESLAALERASRTLNASVDDLLGNGRRYHDAADHTGPSLPAEEPAIETER